jgi:hypothetical protein
MDLTNISYCRYNADQHSRTPQQWNARNIVRAIKGDAFNGYANLKIGERWKTLDQEHPEVAMEWFVNIVKTTTKFDPSTTYILCPIPDSSCTVNSGNPSKTMALALALKAALPKLVIWDGLRFTKAVPRRTRDEVVLKDAMVCSGTPPDGFIYLLDDVCTTGAHVIAAASCLKDLGVKSSIGALSVARTMLTPDDDVFGFRGDKLTSIRL